MTAAPMAERFRIAVYNSVSGRGLERLPQPAYTVGNSHSHPPEIDEPGGVTASGCS